MPSQYRLSRVEFGLMRGFKRLSGAYFSLSYGNIPGRATSGVAVVVSSKSVPGAAARNSVRRRARAVLAEIMKKARGGAVFVLHARKGAGAASPASLRSDVADLMARAGVAR